MENTIIKYKGFEILCKNGTIDSYRNSKLSMQDILLTDNIYTDIKKGNIAKKSDLIKSFNKEDINDCIKIILDEGDYNLTTQERRKLVDKRKDEIISYIMKNYNDLQNNKLNSLQIETILKKIKLVVNPHIIGSRQAKDLINKFKKEFPLKKSSKDGILKFPLYFYNKISNYLSDYCDIICKKSDNEYYYLDIAVSPSDFDNLMEALQKTTFGDFQFEILNNNIISNNDSENNSTIHKKKKKKNK